ncbi:MAG: hypothetical protein ACYDAN_15425 [Candidatus Limnocylindrales bacterium]
MRKNLIATGTVAGALLLGSAGAAVFLPTLVSAAGPTATPAATPSASGAPAGNPGKGPWMGGITETVTDASVAAKAIGVTEAQLNTALASGQTVAQVAKAHNVDVQKVIDALVGDKKDEIAAALKAGTLTQAQADQQLANATTFVTDQVNGTGFGPSGHGRGFGGPGAMGGHGGPGGLAADDLTAAAKALGMTEADLTTQLSGGKTVAQVATAKSVALQTVIDAIAAADKAEFAAAVKAGTMTQAQADQMLANLTAHVTDEVNGVAGRPGGHGGPDGRGGPGGPGGRWGPGVGNGTPNASPSAGTGTSG